MKICINIFAVTCLVLGSMLLVYGIVDHLELKYFIAPALYFVLGVFLLTNDKEDNKNDYYH